MESSTINRRESSTDPTPGALDRATTLVAIARLCLDAGLAAPKTVSFRTAHADQAYLNLDFDTAEQAEAWAKHFDADRYKLDRVYQPEWREGPIRSYTAHARSALGFATVSFDGWTPVAELAEVAA